MYAYKNDKIWPHWHRRELLWIVLQPQPRQHMPQYLYMCEGIDIHGEGKKTQISQDCSAS